MSREPEILKSIIDDTEYNKTPQSRNEEILLSILNPGVIVEPLSVTENGTYTAPAGTAYSPVEVAVPITPGPASVAKKDVNFYDYDGTVVASYTKQEFLVLTEMPANPTHERLTAQGWNWNIDDAKEYVTKHSRLDIGQMYTPTSGALEIDIKLEDGRLHPYLGLNINGSVTVDWGDGSSTDTMTGSSLSTVVRNDHTYSSAGNYTIKVFASDGTTVSIVGGGGNYSNILTHSTSPDQTSATRGYNNDVQSVRISDFIKSIGSNAFSSCYSLSSITLPDTLTSIGFNAFYSCYALSSITLPDTLTSIGDSAFYNCYALSSITLPDTLTSIGLNVFYNCYTLTSVTLPDNLTNIGSGAFSNCYVLTSITLQDNLTNIGLNVFSGCLALPSITLPDKLTSIGTNAFSTCFSLSSVTLPDKLTSIGNNVFSNCYSLSYITLPDTLTSIGSGAFVSCKSLDFVKFSSQTPPTVNSSAFSGIPTSCIIYVPTGTIEAYKATANMPNPSTYTYIEY